MIRRPMLYIVSSFAAAIIISYYWSSIIAVFFGALFLFMLLSKKARCIIRQGVAMMLLVSYLFGAAIYTLEDAKVSRLDGCEGTASLTGTIYYVEQRETVNMDGSAGSYVQMKVKISAIEGRELPRKEKLLVKYYGNVKETKNVDNDGKSGETAFVPGDVLRFSGEIEEPTGRRNPGCFDYRLYLRSLDIRWVMTAEQLEIHGSGRDTPMGRLFLMKKRFLNELEQAAGEDAAGTMGAVLFGEKNGLDEETLEEFQKNGTAHVLAVSGLHVGIIYGFLSILWRWKKGVLFFGCIMGFFICYAALASFSPSVVRAVFMVGLHNFAKLTNRRYDLSSAAFFTALVLLADNPMRLFNAGFQMSFLAVLTLSLMIPLVKQIYSGIFLSSVAVQIGLLPYTIYTFNYISLASVFVNVPVISLTGLLVPAGLCAMVLNAIWPTAFDFCAGVLFGLCRIMTEINAMTGIDGITVFEVVSPPAGFLAMYYLVLLVFVSEEGRLLFLRRKKQLILLLIVMVFSSSAAFQQAAGNKYKESHLVFVDVGQGDCIHFRTEDGKNYLVDGGGSIRYNMGKKTLKPYLLKNGVTAVDGAFVTHLHTDHYKGIAELCREGMVEKLFLYEGCRAVEEEVLKETGMDPEDIVYLYQGHKLELAEDTGVQVLWPERNTMEQYDRMMSDEGDENDASLILKINVKGHTVLATGDVDAACLSRLAEEWEDELRCNILKMAHHGSKYSDNEKFMSVVAPEYAIFQVGKNNFGHPDKGVVEKCVEKDIMVYRNDEDGAIAFFRDRKGRDKVMTVTGEYP